MACKVDLRHFFLRHVHPTPPLVKNIYMTCSIVAQEEMAEVKQKVLEAAAKISKLLVLTPKLLENTGE